MSACICWNIMRPPFFTAIFCDIKVGLFLAIDAWNIESSCKSVDVMTRKKGKTTLDFSRHGKLFVPLIVSFEGFFVSFPKPEWEPCSATAGQDTTQEMCQDIVLAALQWRYVLTWDSSHILFLFWQGEQTDAVDARVSRLTVVQDVYDCTRISVHSSVQRNPTGHTTSCQNTQDEETKDEGTNIFFLNKSVTSYFPQEILCVNCLKHTEFTFPWMNQQMSRSRTWPEVFPKEIQFVTKNSLAKIWMQICSFMKPGTGSLPNQGLFLRIVFWFSRGHKSPTYPLAQVARYCCRCCCRVSVYGQSYE